MVFENIKNLVKLNSPQEDQKVKSSSLQPSIKKATLVPLSAKAEDGNVGLQVDSTSEAASSEDLTVQQQREVNHQKDVEDTKARKEQSQKMQNADAEQQERIRAKITSDILSYVSNIDPNFSRKNIEEKTKDLNDVLAKVFPDTENIELADLGAFKYYLSSKKDSNLTLDKIKKMSDIELENLRGGIKEISSNKELLREYITSEKLTETFASDDTIYQKMSQTLNDYLTKNDPEYQAITDEKKKQKYRDAFIGDMREKMTGKSAKELKGADRKLFFRDLASALVYASANNINLATFKDDNTDLNDIAKKGTYLLQKELIEAIDVNGDPKEISKQLAIIYLTFSDPEFLAIEDKDKMAKYVQSKISLMMNKFSFGLSDLKGAPEEMKINLAKSGIQMIKILSDRGMTIEEFGKASPKDQASITVDFLRSSPEMYKTLGENYEKAIEFTKTRLNLISECSGDAPTERQIYERLKQREQEASQGGTPLTAAEDAMLRGYKQIEGSNDPAAMKIFDEVADIRSSVVQNVITGLVSSTKFNLQLQSVGNPKDNFDAYAENAAKIMRSIENDKFGTSFQALINELKKDGLTKEQIKEIFDKAKLSPYKWTLAYPEDAAKGHDTIVQNGTEEQVIQARSAAHDYVQYHTDEQVVDYGSNTEELNTEVAAGVNDDENRTDEQKVGLHSNIIIAKIDNGQSEKSISEYSNKSITTAKSEDVQKGLGDKYSEIDSSAVTEGMAAAVEDEHVSEGAKEHLTQSVQKSIETHNFTQEETASINKALETGKITEETLAKTTPKKDPLASEYQQNNDAAKNTESTKSQEPTKTTSQTSSVNAPVQQSQSPVATSKATTSTSSVAPSSVKTTTSQPGATYNYASSKTQESQEQLKTSYTRDFSVSTLDVQNQSNNNSVQTSNATGAITPPVAENILPSIKTKEELMAKIDQVIEHIEKTNTPITSIEQLKESGDDVKITSDLADQIANDIAKGAVAASKISDIKESDLDRIKNKLINLVSTSLVQAYAAISEILGASAQDLFIRTLARKGREQDIMAFASQISQDDIIKLINACPNDNIKIRLIGLLTNSSKANALLRKILQTGDMRKIAEIAKYAPKALVEHVEEQAKYQTYNLDLLKTIASSLPEEYQGQVNALILEQFPEEAVPGSDVWRNKLVENMRNAGTVEQSQLDKLGENDELLVAAASTSSMNVATDPNHKDNAIDNQSENEEIGGPNLSSTRMANWKRKGRTKYNNGKIKA